jgi:hypothetical protein
MSNRAGLFNFEIGSRLVAPYQEGSSKGRTSGGEEKGSVFCGCTTQLAMMVWIVV